MKENGNECPTEIFICGQSTFMHEQRNESRLLARCVGYIKLLLSLKVNKLKHTKLTFSMIQCLVVLLMIAIK